MNIIKSSKLFIASIFALLFSMSVVSARVDFSGKTITWVIPFSESGGSAKWANFFAPLLAEELPGNPKVVVRFMPGAGSTKGANWFQNRRHRDGTLLFGSSGSTQFPYLLSDPRVRYEYKDWFPVMGTGTGGVAYLNTEAGRRFNGSADRLKRTRFIYGSQGATTLDLVPLLAWKMLGMNVEPVFGIKGRGDGRLMFERGESNIDYQTTSSYLKGSQVLVDEGSAVPMMTWGTLNSRGDIVRDPTFPDLPTFKEVCEATRGCSARGPEWDAWKAFFVAGFPSQKIAFLPRGTPSRYVDVYTKAFAAVRARQDFKRISAARVGKYPMFVGEEAEIALENATTVSPRAKTFVLDWLEKDYGVTLKR